MSDRPFLFFCRFQQPGDGQILERLEGLAGSYFERLSRQQLLNLRMVLTAVAAYEESGYLASETLQIRLPGEQTGLEPAAPVFSSALRLSSELSLVCREGLLHAIQDSLRNSELHRKTE